MEIINYQIGDIIKLKSNPYDTPTYNGFYKIIRQEQLRIFIIQEFNPKQKKAYYWLGAELVEKRVPDFAIDHKVSKEEMAVYLL